MKRFLIVLAVSVALVGCQEELTPAEELEMNSVSAVTSEPVVEDTPTTEAPILSDSGFSEGEVKRVARAHFNSLPVSEQDALCTMLDERPTIFIGMTMEEIGDDLVAAWSVNEWFHACGLAN